jgi:DNA-binding NarL/FixJ family response regulator
MEESIKVVFADDHEIFRDGLSMLLNSLSGIELIASVKNGRELIQTVQQQQPDVVLTDIKMPFVDGIEATKFIKANFTNINIVALTMYDEEQQIIEMLEAGAIGYLVKDASKEEMHEAILAAFNNYNFYCRHTTSKITKLLTTKNSNIVLDSKRDLFKGIELEIIKHICNGLTSKEIGKLIHLSFRTVEGYRVKIQEKMDVTSVAGLMKFAYKHKLIDLSA